MAQRFGRIGNVACYPVVADQATRDGKVTDDLKTVGFRLTPDQARSLIAALTDAVESGATNIDLDGWRHEKELIVMTR